MTLRELLKTRAAQATTGNEIKTAIIDRLKTLFPEVSVSELRRSVDVLELNPFGLQLSLNISLQLVPMTPKEETPA